MENGVQQIRQRPDYNMFVCQAKALDFIMKVMRK
jgi:hypothetical protein